MSTGSPGILTPSGSGAPDVCHPEAGTGLVWGRSCEVWGARCSCNDEAWLESLCDMTFTLQSLSVSSVDHEENEAWASSSSYTHTHTLSWKTVLSHPRKDLLFQLNPSRSTPHVRKERKNQIKPELLWPSPWGSIYIK